MNDINETPDFLQTQMKAFFQGHSLPAYVKNSETNEILETNLKFDENRHDHEAIAKRVAAKSADDSSGVILYKGLKYDIQSNVISPCLEMVTIKHISMLFEDCIDEYIEVKKASHAIFEDLYLEKINAHVVAEELSQKLADSEMKFRKLAHIAPIGIIYADEYFNIRWTNKQTAEIFGCPVKNGTSFIDLGNTVEVKSFHKKIERLRKGPEKVHLNFKISIEETTKYVKCIGISFMHGSKMPEGYVFILEDISETELYIKEITNNNLKLNEVNLELDKFLYSVFHNIRGPLASLEGLLDILKTSDPSAMDQLKHHLRLNLQLLNSFVSDIKSVAINMHTSTSIKPIDLRKMIDQLIIFNEEIHDVKVKNINEIPFQYELHSDINRLNMVLRNIIKNSFQYRDKNKDQLVMQISVKQSDKYHIIEISDNGTGLCDDIKPKVFDMFYRGSELSKGNGMGLFNAKTIIEKLSGTIEIQSEENEFCTVRVFLPVIPKEQIESIPDVEVKEIP